MITRRQGINKLHLILSHIGLKKIMFTKLANSFVYFKQICSLSLSVCIHPIIQFSIILCSSLLFTSSTIHWLFHWFTYSCVILPLFLTIVSINIVFIINFLILPLVSFIQHKPGKIATSFPVLRSAYYSIRFVYLF